MAQPHRERAVGAGRGVDPLVGELHALGVVGGDRDDLLAAVARLGHPVRVGGAGDGHVAAPHEEVRRVPPVAGLGHVGLVAEHLRGGVGEVGVPVVERQHRRTDQLEEAGAGRVGDRGHRGDRGEAGDPVGAPALHGVDVGGRDDLRGLLPRGAHEPALAAGGLVARGLLGVLDDRAPGDDRVAVLPLGLAEHLQQHAADVGVADPGGAVGVPGEGRATGAAAGLVLRPVRPGAGVVGLLGLPGDDPVLDVDLPRAGARAVDAVGAAHDLVVAPAVAVEVVGLPPALLREGASVRRHLPPGEEPAGPHQRLGQRSVQLGSVVLRAHGHAGGSFSPGCGGGSGVGGRRGGQAWVWPV